MEKVIQKRNKYDYFRIIADGFCSTFQTRQEHKQSKSQSKKDTSSGENQESLKRKIEWKNVTPDPGPLGWHYH